MANTRFATVGANGALRTFLEYGQAFTGQHPPGTVPLTNEQWDRWRANPAAMRWQDGVLAATGTPAASVPHDMPKLLVLDRIGSAGALRAFRAALKLDGADADLTDAELMTRDWWDASTSVRSDNAQVRAALSAAGVNPDVILAAPPGA